MNEDSCVFLVHVPKLRKYEDEAKDMMSDLAWVVASGVLGQNGFGSEKTLAVGTKGSFLYHRIDVGEVTAQSEDSDGPRGIRSSGSNDSVLEKIFPGGESTVSDQR